MGRKIKIEIDDKIPLNHLGHSLLPQSINKNEIWAAVFTKALIKLNSGRWTEQNLEYGDGSVIYALTGYIPETIDLTVNFNSITLTYHYHYHYFIVKWRQINEALNEENFANLGIFATCYCKPDHKPMAPSNKNINLRDLVLDHKPLEKGGRSRLSMSISPIQATIVKKRNFSEDTYLEGNN